MEKLLRPFAYSAHPTKIAEGEGQTTTFRILSLWLAF